MFGLKIVKKQEYLALQKKVEDLQVRIENQNAIISSLEKEYNEVSTQLHQLQNPNPDEGGAILLTDVAEKPLEVEKPKRQRATKKSTKSTKTTTRKRTRKTEKVD